MTQIIVYGVVGENDLALVIRSIVARFRTLSNVTRREQLNKWKNVLPTPEVVLRCNDLY